MGALFRRSLPCEIELPTCGRRVKKDYRPINESLQGAGHLGERSTRAEREARGRGRGEGERPVHMRIQAVSLAHTATAGGGHDLPGRRRRRRLRLGGLASARAAAAALGRLRWHMPPRPLGSRHSDGAAWHGRGPCCPPLTRTMTPGLSDTVRVSESDSESASLAASVLKVRPQ